MRGDQMGKDPRRIPSSPSSPHNNNVLNEQLNLPPGFRFCPTDEELLVDYLCQKAASQHFAVPIIAELELYKFDPWELPERALFGEKEWYFFSPRDRKYPNGSRPNRAAGTGYWKATGTDKPISTMDGKKMVGVKKALVFYKGKAPRGVKTNWIMHEYRLAEGAGVTRYSRKSEGSLRLDGWVLCRIYKKSSSTAAMQVKGPLSAAGTKVEQSESSTCLGDALARLSEVEDAHVAPMQGLDTEVEAASPDSYHWGSSSESRVFTRQQLQEDGAMMDQFKDEQVEGPIASARGHVESICIEHSPSEHSTRSQVDEEENVVESTFNSLAALPLTQLLNTNIDTVNNLSFPTSAFDGLDLGLPSPCTMLASRSDLIEGGSLISTDFDHIDFFQPTQLNGWESSCPERMNIFLG